VCVRHARPKIRGAIVDAMWPVEPRRSARVPRDGGDEAGARGVRGAIIVKQRRSARAAGTAEAEPERRARGANRWSCAALCRGPVEAKPERKARWTAAAGLRDLIASASLRAAGRRTAKPEREARWTAAAGLAGWPQCVDARVR
jgi:hypothetical protein